MKKKAAKTGRRTLLTPEVQQKIVSYIRAGAFDWVAAEACGIGERTFYHWLKEGAAGRQPYLQFLQEVTTARAEARAAAELEVRKMNPFAWLRYGPGREKPGKPGWTETYCAEHTGADGGPIQIEDPRQWIFDQIAEIRKRRSEKDDPHGQDIAPRSE